MELKKYRFCELYEMGSGVSTTPKMAGHGYPFASFSTIFNNPILPEVLPDLMDTTEKQRNISSIKEGDILLTRTSETIDELAMSSVAVKDYPNATFSGFAKRLRPIQDNITYPKFMAFYLRSPYFRKIIDANAIMTLRASFNENIFSYLNLYLPNFQSQVKIGDFFWKIEQKIRLNKKINENLNHIANLIYDYWFNQFEFPNEEGKPYKSSGGKMVWNDELKREIPEGWNATDLSKNDLCSVINIGVKKFKEKNYLATANVDHEQIFEGVVVDFEHRESRANMEPTKYSVWFAKMKGSIKHISIPRNSEWFINKYILSTGFYGFQCNEKTFSYIHCFINDENFENRKDQLSHGSNQLGISDGDLPNIKFVKPTDKVLEDYSKLINPLLERKFLTIYENQMLSYQQEFLLPLLMNGQATFSD